MECKDELDVNTFSQGIHALVDLEKLQYSMVLIIMKLTKPWEELKSNMVKEVKYVFHMQRGIVKLLFFHILKKVFIYLSLWARQCGTGDTAKDKTFPSWILWSREDGY